MINLIAKCMSKLSMCCHCTKARVCAKSSPKVQKRPPETLDIIMQMWYNGHVVKGRRKYDVRRGRIKNRDKIDPLNYKIRPTI